jgi:hypothetical protein
MENVVANSQSLWSYEEGMYHFECFLNKLPENYKMEALCEICHRLLNCKTKMKRDRIDIMFKNATLPITMEDIDQHLDLLKNATISKTSHQN